MRRSMTDAWSITDGYHDEGGTWHDTDPEVRAALARAMGGDGHDRPPPAATPQFVAAGATTRLAARADLILEDGTRLADISALPPDLPLGYHRLTPHEAPGETLLVVSPRRCPPAPRAWGWAVQLYALRSASSWGMGDLADLRELARWAASRGASVVMTNPLHANAPVARQEPSPYYPSSRIWGNPLYLRVEDVPGAAALGAQLDPLAAAGRALNDTDRIDRDAVFALKRAALERLFAAFEDRAPAAEREAFAAYQARHGEALTTFTTFSALAERHGPSFRAWPVELRHPSPPAVAAFAATPGEAPRRRFHAWLQWLLDRQLAAAGATGVRLVGDLAVGFEPGGADAWAYQDLLAQGCRVGAPPDNFNAQGQDWGLPPFVPWRLRAAGYAPVVATLRACLTHLGGLRIDHVMGLFRLYWIPPETDARRGAYVRYPADELLDILALEATRNGGFVVGEDLGTVEDVVREEMRARDMLGNRLVWFEREAPRRFPERALAAVNTHDLPTIAGVWTGADMAEQRRIWGPDASDDGDRSFRERLRAATGVAPSTPVPDVVVAAHEALAEAPSTVVLGSLDDACAAVLRPNLPGTIDERPNWRIPLPLTLEEIEADPLVHRVADALSQHR